MPGPTYTFTATIPQATDQISQSQALILANNQAVNELISVDHVAFNTPNIFGQHKKVTFPVQNPAPVPALGTLNLYNFLEPIANQNQLYFTDALGNTYPASGSGVGSTATNGWSYTLSGFILKWATTNNGAAQNIQTLSGGPVFGTILSSQVTLLSAPSSGIWYVTVGGGTIRISGIPLNAGLQYQYLILGF